MTEMNEIFISVDVETSGPIPGVYSLLTIGACDVSDPQRTFECKIKPTSKDFDPAALEVSGLSLDALESEGLLPEDAMRTFKDWLVEIAGPDTNIVFVGFNASFDWSFVNYYFHKYLGENPFGFAALDIKSMYFGAANVSWRETRSSAIVKSLNPVTRGDHDALRDATFQAELFRLIKAKLQ